VSEVYRAASLDELRAEGDGPALGDKLGVTGARYEQFVKSHALTPYLAALPPREHDILITRFFQEMTQSQIAERLGISQMQVSRQLATTLAGLRDAVDGDQPFRPQSTLSTGPSRMNRAGDRTTVDELH
jgi:RNA polymerase sigma-B factor